MTFRRRNVIHVVVRLERLLEPDASRRIGRLRQLAGGHVTIAEDGIEDLRAFPVSRLRHGKEDAGGGQFVTPGSASCEGMFPSAAASLI